MLALMRRSACGIAAFFLACSYAAYPSSADNMTRVDTFGGWSLIADTKTPHVICFVTAEPTSSAPANTQRDAPRAYISAWPKSGIKGEVSFRMGFKIKKGAEGLAKVSPAGFRLFGSGDRAYVNDSTQELKLLDAMRKGSALTVAIAADGGATVTDTYSLNGLGVAMQMMQQACF